MKELKNRILEDGKALNETVLKVDTFLNHQVDSKLMYNMGTYFKEYFKNHGITRILTIESSGIAPTAMTAMQMDLPMVILKKQQSKILNGNVYQTTVHSFTKGSDYDLTLKKYNLGPIDEDTYKILVGDGYEKLIERALIHCGDNNLENYEDALVTYMEYFKIHCMHEVKAYDGIHDMLDFLKKNDIKIAVLSNKPHAQTVENVDSIFGNGYFDNISGEKPNVKRKPDPEGAIIIANELDVNPCECLYIGDTNTDMKTGIGAGMDVVGVTWGFRDRKELESFNPKYVIDHPSEIIDIVKSTVLVSN